MKGDAWVYTINLQTVLLYSWEIAVFEKLNWVATIMLSLMKSV